MTTIQHKNRRSGKVVLGVILLVAGVLLLGKTFGLHIPDWIFSWPMLLIVIGLVKGFKHKFRIGSFILISIGVIFLLERILPHVALHAYFWPLIIIGIGLYLIFGRNKRPRFGNGDFDFGLGDKKKDWDVRIDNVDEATAGSPQQPFAGSGTFHNPTDDFIDAVCVFGAVRKNIVSKHFRGGDIVAFMGGADINLSQADIQGEVVLDVTAVFGGVKIVLPGNWKVVSEMSAVFGGIEDKRQILQESVVADKLLVLRGTSVFGGIEIKNF